MLRLLLTRQNQTANITYNYLASKVRLPGNPIIKPTLLVQRQINTFSTDNNNSPAGGADDQSQSWMDTFAQKPVSEGAKTQMKNIKTKDRLLNQQARKQSSKKRTMFDPTLAEQGKKIDKKAYLDKFGLEKPKLIRKLLQMDAAQLVNQCESLGITLPSEAHQNSSTQMMQVMYRYLETFEAEEITKVAQGEGGQTRQVSNATDKQRKKQDLGSQIDEANAQVQKALGDMTKKYSKKTSTELFQVKNKNEAVEIEEELYLEPGEETFGIKNIIDVPQGPMRKLKPAPLFSFSAIVNENTSKAFQTLQGANSLKEEQFKFTVKGTSRLDSEAALASYETFFQTEQHDQKNSSLLDKELEGLLQHDTLQSLTIDLSGVSPVDKQLVTSTLQQIKKAKTSLNPNLAFKELKLDIFDAQNQIIDPVSKGFKVFLQQASKHITQLNHENKTLMVETLRQIDALPASTLSTLAKDVSQIQVLSELSLVTNTSMPNLLKLNASQDFLVAQMQDIQSPAIVDEVASCIFNFIKMASRDYELHLTNEQGLKDTVSTIQAKVEQIHSLLLTERGQKSAYLDIQLNEMSPNQLLKRVVLLPTPSDGSRLQRVLGSSLKALLSADMQTENGGKGLFTPCERNYILARGMQVQKDKELQNDMRILGSSTAGINTHLVVDEGLHSCYIIGGKLTQDSELNNIHHLASLMPPSVAKDTHDVNNMNHHSRIDDRQVFNMRSSLKKQLTNCSTSTEMRTMLDFFEFQQKYAPLSVWKNSSNTPLFQTLAQQTARFQFALQDLIRLQNIVLVSMQKPTYLFDEILAHKESLASDVDKPVLNIFIEEILARMTQHQVIFDHLTNSTSSIHRDFLSSSNETFLVLSKTLNDLVSEGGTVIPDENFALVNKILSEEEVTTKVFDSSDQASTVLGPFLTQQLKHLEVRNASQADRKSYSTLQAQIENLKKYDAIFKALRAVKPLISNDPSLLQCIASTVDVALKNLMQDLNNYSAPSNLDTQAVKKFTKEHFPLDQLIRTNKSILDAIASLEANQSQSLMTKSYLAQTPLSAIIDRTLRNHLYKQDTENQAAAPYEFLADQRANKLIANAIEQETWGKIERLSGPVISYFNQMLDSEVLDVQRKNELLDLTERFLLKILNSRSLYGVDLARFFKLIRQLQERNQAAGCHEDIFDELIMNVSCNLRTLGVNLLFQIEEDSSNISIGTDSLFQKENNERVEKDRQYKTMIFEMYKDVFKRNPELFSNEKSFGLSPLSVVFAELFDQMSFEDHRQCLSMLGSHSVDNYTEEFIQKLYDAYSQEHQVRALFDEDVEKFITLAGEWPKFLQNNVLLTELTMLDASNFSLENQSRVLSIQTRKNLINPQFIKHHFTQLISSTDKDQVKSLLANFMHSIAYVGHTENINMEQVTTVLRRIYKEPSNVDDELLLDFLVTLAVSNSRFEIFDIKSKDFVEKALDLIEAKFTGTKQIAPYSYGKDQSFELFLFNQIPSARKSYNKILDKNTPNFEANLSKDGKREYFQNAANALQRKSNFEEEEISQQELLKFDISDTVVNSDDDEIQMAGPDASIGENRKRIYDRGASERGSPFDEQHYFKVRSQKLARMAKKDNHLLLYSNVNTLDFVDINSNSIAKAWTTLFHFRGKSIESMLFEEFNSIAQRNTLSKAKNHEVFNKMYLELNSECYKHNLQVEMAGSCERTGWPIDLSLSHYFQKGSRVDAAEANTEAHQDTSQPFAIYFLLQEEICYNSWTRKEEPLGLQKLMLRHLSQISNYRVCTVDENMAMGDIDSAIAKIQEEFYPLLSTPRKVVRQTPDARTSSPEQLEGDEIEEQGYKVFSLSSQDDFVSEDEEDIIDMPMR